jgi:magnesium-protoporphyrin O-methyltransferase
MVDFLRDRGIAGATVLEIGGGVGEIGIELVRAGAERAENLELSPAYANEARKLAEEKGVAELVALRIHDITENPETVEPADIVVMHRVVCCYPDYERLLRITARRARHTLVFSYPRRNAISRSFIGAANLLQRLKGSTFRAFTHPPAAMLNALEGQELHLAYEHHAPIWQIAGHQRETERMP